MMIRKSDIKKWCAALDSGKYKQTYITLQDNRGYCCLGVACDIFIEKKEQLLKYKKLIGDMPGDQINSPKWLQRINDDFSRKCWYSLTHLNDNERLTFSEVATILELVYIHKILD